MDKYEKLYNDALAWMRELYPGLHGATKEDAEHYFPELRESEDERMFNRVIESLVCYRGKLEPEVAKLVDKEIQWMLKCKESLHIPESCKENPDSFTDEHPNIIYTEMGEEFAKQKKQKSYEPHNWPADKDNLTQEQKPVETSDFKTKLAAYLQNNSPKDGQYVISSESILQMAKEELIKRGELQKPVEWSEEDEKIIRSIRHILFEHAFENGGVDVNGDYCKDVYIQANDFLLSLRPSWKPSEEHLSALLAVFNDPDNIGSQTCQLALTDLYEHLKKL